MKPWWMVLLNPWLWLGLLMMLLLAFGAGYWKGSSDGDAGCAAKSAKAQVTETKKADAETTRREVISTQREAAREQVRIVYRTIKEKAHEIEVGASGVGIGAVGCGLNDDGLRVWNAANSGITEGLPSESDYRLPSAAASTVGAIGRLVGQPHRSDGAIRAMPGSVSEVGGVRERTEP